MFVGSRTSTVIPYDILAKCEGAPVTKLLDTSFLKKEIAIKETPEVLLVISGGVSWLDLKIFCTDNNLFPLTSLLRKMR